MKLLFDENLSPRLTSEFQADFPGSRHVTELGLGGAQDRQIWELARTEGFAIVSKDTDFRERSFVEGTPPKIIWLAVGNAGTDEIVRTIRSRREQIEAFDSDEETSLLVLSRSD